MITRSIYIGSPSYLKLQDNQLKIICAETKAVKGSVPVEDLGILMLDNFQITISNQLIQKLMGHNVVIVSCDAHHLPHGMMLPLYGNTEHSERVRDQMEASEPLKKQLWKQTVEAKIRNQTSLLVTRECSAKPMETYMSNVKSGDTTNMEGIAAQHYWKQLMGKDFLRERFGETPNAFLNFGYAVLRSMVARSLVESGLLPVLGIFHRNKYNPYCLADDVMEPYRPFVDDLVIDWISRNDSTELTKELKAHLLRQATIDVRIDGKNRPLMVAVAVSCSSLYKCYTGERRTILYPEFT